MTICKTRCNTRKSC